jgi:hypothetical protein
MEILAETVAASGLVIFAAVAQGAKSGNPGIR